jgi:hypothetical protein
MQQDRSNFYQKLVSFYFILLLILMSKVPENVNVISQLLQRDGTGLSAVASLLKTAKNNLAQLRTNFDSFVEES